MVAKAVKGSVVAAVERDLVELGRRDRRLAESGLAASARALAARLDDSETSATAAAACAKALREVLDRLRELAPAVVEADGVNELQARADRKLRRRS